jgi:hypothetical protein
MKITRRATLFTMLATAVANFLPKAAQASDGDIRHILPTVTANSMGLSVSVGAPRTGLTLAIDDREIAGQQTDTLGRFWSFQTSGLSADTEYMLQLSDGDDPVGSSWPLKTFPETASLPEQFRLLAFTCAGGADGFGVPGRQFFKPHAFRQKMFETALTEKPDAVLAIGDHIYWDLRGGNMPAVGRRSWAIKLLAGWYLRFRYGAFDRSQPLLGTDNEAVLTTVGDEQIADLYGTRFRSTPIFFISDDHDYFENDDAEEDLVTFPPDAFSAAAFEAVADLYYPSLPDGPSSDTARAFGLLKYGRLFEGVLFDCAGHMSVDGDDATLVPRPIEDWIAERAVQSDAAHFAFVPSHPMGWTAGKWREWYPDVVAPEGFEGVVTNELMGGETVGALTTKAQKYLWQKGWWEQHQRLLGSLAARAGSRFMLSGDIHAQGAVMIERSGTLDLFDQPVTSLLVGPVSTSDATWPSSARGISADTPDWLKVETLLPTREVNGLTMLSFTPTAASARMMSCGGYDRSLEEDGRVQQVDEITLT